MLAFLSALLFAFAVRILTRSGAVQPITAPGATPADEPAARLTAQELACLTGGSRRVIEASIAQLVDTGRLRASRDGYLRVPPGRSTEGDDPVERTVLAEVHRHGRRSITMLTYRLAGSDAVQEVADRLVRSGHMVNPVLAARRKVIGLVPLVALLAVGTVRWLAGIADDRPVGWLAILLIGVGAAAYAIHRQPICPRTFHGATAVGDVKTVTPAETVAVGGFSRHPDVALRESLGGMRAVPTGNTGVWPADGAAAGGSAGSAGAGGGSSRGGGGCGG
ncbi:MAG: TIGR04222 domain-containing membrane protein [Kibdelosporangium sp.]